MSDTGLYSNLYDRIHSVAALVDHVLLSLSQETPVAKDDVRQLSDLFLGGRSAIQTVSYRLLTAIVDELNSSLNLGALGNGLRQEPVPSDVIKDLEQLAAVLDKERAAALYQLRK